MPDFLSEQWLAALAAACVDAPAVDDVVAGQLVVEPVVRGVPARGVVHYRIVFSGGTCAVVSPGDAALDDSGADAADVRLETDYVTAVALARGTANAQAALADGRFQVSGDVARLAEYASALARLDDLFAALRASTTYPSP